MSQFLEIFRFELRYQTKSPFFWGVLILFPLVHFLSVATNTIDIGNLSDLININSPYRTMYTEAALAYFGLLPTIVFMVSAITRDQQRNTAELFFVAPVTKYQFLLGRFCGGFCLALLVAFAGLLGGMLAIFMPWLDPARLSPFSISTYSYSFFALTAPYTFIVCSFFFAIAALTRSVAMTFVIAMLLMLLNFLLLIYSATSTSEWIGLADITGLLGIAVETRYWTIAELNILLPNGLLLVNRLLWISLTLLVLVITFCRFRFDLSAGKAILFHLPGWAKTSKTTSSAPALTEIRVSNNFSWKGQISQFLSQLSMDIRTILQSPFFYAVLFFGVFSTIGDHQSHLSLVLNIPLIPVTSLMIGFFRYGLIANVLLILIYFSAELVHRERESRVNDIVGASPYADWIMPVSKTIALWVVISLLLVASMFTSILLQG
ncbi:MAG: ABC transporter permease subunit, partial [Pseudohongiella sp.]|nr:ABC transporter permease subunit [Pseudohongiella sp.]